MHLPSCAASAHPAGCRTRDEKPCAAIVRSGALNVNRLSPPREAGYAYREAAGAWAALIRSIRAGSSASRRFYSGVRDLPALIRISLFQGGPHAGGQGGPNIIVNPVPNEQDLLRRFLDFVGGDPNYSLQAGLAGVKFIRVELYAEELQQPELT